MPVVGPALGVYVLTRVAGTLQKYLFAQFNRGPIEQAVLAARKGLKSDNPEVRAKARQLLGLLNMVTGSWDLAEGIAYDDPVELLADVAALGVKLHLFRAGVKFFPRILQAGGTKLAIQGIEVMMQVVGMLTDGDFKPESLTKFFDRFADTKELGEDAGRLAGETFDVLGAAVGLSADIASGNLLAIPGGVANIARQAGEFLAALVGFAQKVESSLPSKEERAERARERFFDPGFRGQLTPGGRAVQAATTATLTDVIQPGFGVPGVFRPRVQVPRRDPRAQPTRETRPKRDPELPGRAVDPIRLRGVLQRSSLRTGGLLDLLGELKRGG